MWDKKYPSIFDIFESFTKGFPFERKERFGEDWFKEPFESMIQRFEESMPSEFNELVREEKTPSGVSRRYGPFVYGFSYTAEPGKEPVFREFGNIKPSYRGIEPSEGREPLVDVMSEKDKYKIFAELPGVEKDQVKLDVADDSVQIKTDDEKKFYKMIYLDSPVDPESAKASYKNGILTLELDKKEKRIGKEVKID
ncbi:MULTISPECIES: archaeal heat shock protein Hsp20 [Methanothrix]|jgi:HSP20 family protein|uniref:Hsp20/alpha crystallin family protein n=1 Tax=Methanothrix soehngenii TaxID=2223 RepID=A0A7K4AL44_METSH|nr:MULTISPECIES: archaeal heat shock protein Hsp20 [Methanothrix]NLJ23672.1 Hsp20/alpha crystallin family protein [Methanothrix soehngenii]UEC40993.1 MAG: Hsp20/alpha crystallin family protein [Methanothrix sp.]HOE44906.1 Hsp20/alpha crystallin family protein [Methanothrix soehngenii]HOS21472.1 Hsp20/alpha crystallin family protein [Methanothrix soehngenii]HPL19782.1 Hsp20/alpha crystallin family protein [Methanothrix soehngenii]